MARAGIVFGLILCGITVAGLVGTTAKMPSQFFAMMLGIPILCCGVVALNPHRRRVAMLIASTIAATGAILGAMRSSFQLLELTDGSTVNERYSLRLVAVMTAVCLLFVCFCVAGLYRMRRRDSALKQAVGTTVRLPSSSSESRVRKLPRQGSREIA
jgi:cytochrome bd-type quinol oxidase subunit 2